MSRRETHFYEFGPYRLDATERLLTRSGAPIPLTLKAFDILLMLVESAGHVLEREELMNKVWPDTVVEENNLTQNISALRKALSEGAAEHQYIETVPRRGYRFIADVRELLNEEAELVVARRARSRVVIEEEETRSADRAEAEQAFSDRELTAASGKQRQRSLRPSAILGICVALAGLATMVYLLRPKPSTASQPVRSIAVLPFKPLGAEGGDEYLGLGMADALITRLSNIKEIVVRPTSAVLKYTNPEKDSVLAARELAVDALLDGAMQRSGNRIRVTVQLLRASDGAPLWAGKFDEDFTNIFAVQDSISEHMARALLLTLSGEERRLLTKRFTENSEAYQEYQMGRYFWNKRTAEGMKRAIEYFQQAIDKDPGYAIAYAGLADCYALGYMTLLPNEFMPKARAAAMQALEIDERLAEAHASLGTVRWQYDYDWLEGEKEYKRAIELNPSYASVHGWYGMYFALTGRFDESLAEMKRAQEIDPTSLVINVQAGNCLYFARQYDQAIDALRRTLDMDPNFQLAHDRLSLVYEQKGMFSEVVREDLAAHPETADVLRKAYVASGWKGYCQKRLDLDRSRQSYVSPYLIARSYARLGEKDEAFDWLEKAYEERSHLLVYLKADPFGSLASDPRFADLLRRVGLAP